MEPRRHLRPPPPKAKGWMRWPRLLLILCVQIIVFCAPSFGASLVKISRDFNYADLTNYVDLLADPSQQLTIDQVARGPAVNNFAPANRTSFQNANTHNAYWLRFGIDNPEGEAFMLALDLRSPDKISIQAFDSALQRLTVRGDPALQLLIPAKSKQLYYLRVEPDGLTSSHLALLSLDRYVATYRAQSWFNGIFQGCILIIAFVATVVGLLRRDRAYGWLATNCLALALFLIIFHRDPSVLLTERIWLWKYRDHLLQVCLLFSCVSSIGIARHIPITTTENQRGTLALQLLLVCTVLAAPLVFVLRNDYGTALILALLILTAVVTINIAVFNFLKWHRRELLLYALTRMSLLILLIAGSLAWYTNNSIRDLADSAMPFIMTIEITGILVILLGRSFEQQREHARSERQIAILEAEARSRTEIVADVGHRVRTPVSGVLGMLEMLQDTSLSATQLDYLNTVRRAANELLNTINEISDISRLQSHTTLQQSVFDPHALLTECIDGFRRAASAHYLELISDISPELPASVLGDSTRLRQIILQLVHQVVSHFERGDIIIEMHPLRRDWLRIEIKSRAIFTVLPSNVEQTVRISESANMREAIARQLIDMLGGHLQIERMNDGNLRTWFDLELPFVERNIPTTHLDTTLQNKRLLVIDDNTTFCEVLERQLRHWGMTAFTAHTMQEGFARLRNQLTLSQSIDVLLIDIDMPEIEQSDWMQRLHNEIQPSPIVIFLSSEPSKSAHTPSADSRHTLLKPINHTSLKITLIEEFKRREQQRLHTAHKRSDPIRCLFAEDNPLNSTVLASMLDRLGVIYTATTNGQEAVDACRRGNFDIVLMDWDMPVMDGWEASRSIREIFEIRGQPSIPIITLTANTVEELGERARQPVTDAHLVKPIQLQDLRELLEQWTGKMVTPFNELSGNERAG